MKINFPRGLGLSLAAVAVALVPLTACSSSSSKGSASGTSATTGSAAVTGTTVSTAPTTTPPKTSTVSTTKPVTSTPKPSTTSASRTSTNSTSSAPAECLTAHLDLASAGGGGAGGTDYRKYSFTNTGARTCTLRGYAGVSIVDSKGTTVQRPAQRGVTGTETPPPVKTISLGADGGKAYFLVTSINVIPSGNDCQHAFHGARLRVYPPNNTAPLYLNDTRDFCDLGVGAVTKGVNG